MCKQFDVPPVIKSKGSHHKFKQYLRPNFLDAFDSIYLIEHIPYINISPTLLV